MKSKTVLPQIRAGQVWQLSDSAIHIVLMGKTLVHFKRALLGNEKAAPIRMIGQPALIKFLAENKAILANPAPA